MTAEPLTPEEEAVIREWASEDHGESIKFTPTDLSRLLATLDAARKAPPSLDVEPATPVRGRAVQRPGGRRPDHRRVQCPRGMASGTSSGRRRSGPDPMSTETRDALRAEDVARLFHETYERLAPLFGYETRRDSAVPWDQVPEQNRRLMVAVAGEVVAALRATDVPVAEGLRRFAHVPATGWGISRMVPSPKGEWVRFVDIAALATPEPDA